MDKKRIYYIYKIIFLCGSLKDHYYIGKRCSILPKYLAIKEDINEYIIAHPDFDNYTGSGKIPTSYFIKYDKQFGITYKKEILKINSGHKENQYWEKYFVNNLYINDSLCENLQPGGNYNPMLYKENNPSFGKKLSQETKEKLSKSLKEYYKIHHQKWIGITRPEETRKKISQSLKYYFKINGTVSHPHTEEQKQKLSISHKKLWQNEEYRNKCLEGQRNYYKDHHGNMFGKHLSEERKQHLSKINKGKPNPTNKGENNGMYGKIPANARKVYQYTKEWDFVNEWNSIMEASRFYTGGERTNISCVCNGKRHFALGYRWSYEKIADEKLIELKKIL